MRTRSDASSLTKGLKTRVDDYASDKARAYTGSMAFFSRTCSFSAIVGSAVVWMIACGHTALVDLPEGDALSKDGGGGDAIGNTDGAGGGDAGGDASLDGTVKDAEVDSGLTAREARFTGSRNARGRPDETELT